MKLLPLIFPLFLLSCFSPTLAQPAEEEEVGFAFVENTQGKQSKIIFLKEGEYKKTYQYKIAKEVFDQLVEARGDFRMRVPDFVMSDAERQVAVAKPRKGEITLEMKAYEVCRSLGKDSLNALAALLSHELIHYYEKHDWTNHFARQHRDSKTGAELHNLDEGLKLETQADYLGGFLSYSAGYQTLDIMPRLLEAVYQQYGLTARISGYPSLDERKSIATQSLEKLQSFVYVYETANHLIALEQYEYAKLYLDYILKDFQSREIYNNAGVIAAHAAMKYISNPELKFIFPIELDGESRLGKGGTKGFGKLVKELLEQAITYFEQANQLDKDYPVAMLNLACVHTLLENFDDAEFYARKAQKRCDDAKWAKTKTDILVLQGILADRQGDATAAASFFKKAKKAGNSLADINLKLLNEEPLGDQSIASKGFAAKEKVDEFSLDKAVANLMQGTLDVDEKIEIDKNTLCGFINKPNSDIYVHFVDSKHYAFFQLSKPSFSLTTNNAISKGSSYDEVITKYGQPDRSVEKTGGRMLIYYSKDLLFVLNKDSKVETIGVFRFENVQEQD